MRINRRELIHNLGISAAAIPFLAGLPSLNAAPAGSQRKRLIFVFSPNGTVPGSFWPDKTGEDFELKEILQPLEPLQDQLLVLKGVCNKVRGDGDSHMRGMSCLLTGIELFAGNIMGGGGRPAGWPKGLSIDQEIKNFLQTREDTRTRFGSLELGVLVGDRSDPWTRWSYAGPNKPITPIDDPDQLFRKLYGGVQDLQAVQSILDLVHEDLKKVESYVSSEDRHLLSDHQALVREMELDLKAAQQQKLESEPPALELGVDLENDRMPEITQMQMDLLFSALANDMARVATFQFTRSVGNARMTWLGVDEGHHSLSHDPDKNEKSQEKLRKINRWYCEQIYRFAQRLADTPEPGADGSMLDHTTIVWTNELGKGNSHTLDNIPFVLLGGGLGFSMGRSLDLKGIPHNRLLLTFAHALDHRIEQFGNPRFRSDGPLSL